MSELYVYMLPYQIIEQIWFYLDDVCKIFTCKEYYNNYHYLLREKHIIKNYDSYVRSMIREDHSFVFDYIVNENLEAWRKKNKICYKNIIYFSYLHFILDLIREYSSQKCKSVLWNCLNTCGYGENVHKNKRNKGIKWTN